MTGKYWDRPWSLVDGCTPCSPSCDHCWSMAMGKRFKKWPDRVTVRPDRLDIPLKNRKPTVFAVWNDLFHEKIPQNFIAESIEIITRCPQHTFLVLTKRAERMLKWAESWRLLPFLNLWLGVTVCNQAEANEKIPLLLQTPAAHRWVSIEPMLGPVDLSIYCMGFDSTWNPEREDDGMVRLHDPGIHAVVLGGETGPGARPMHPDWVRSVRDQCKAAGVPFYFKQWGEWSPGRQAPNLTDKYMAFRKCILMDYNAVSVGTFSVGHTKAGRLLDGCEHNDLPWSAKRE